MIAVKSAGAMGVQPPHKPRVATGCIDYFPDAIAAVAEVSRVCNDQHNPSTPMRWDRAKSTDQANTLIRHFIRRGTLDHDGQRHSAKVAWRALALLQTEIEAERKPVSRPCGCPERGLSPDDRYDG